jgi:hypothetical protein
LETEADVAGIIDSIKGQLTYNTIIGEVPSAHDFLLGNKAISTIANRFPAVSRLNSVRYVVSFAEKELDRYTSSEECIVDWEYSEFFPDYIEYVVAVTKCEYEGEEWWREILNQVLTPCDPMRLTLLRDQSL